MANQDQHEFDDQQEFDEFDNLVDDSSAMMDDDFGFEDTSGRKKRQMVFYIVLLLMASIGGGAAWFLFFRPADTATPLPMPTSEAPVAENMDAPALPPGVTMPEDAANSTPTQDDSGMPPLADDVGNAIPLPPAVEQNAAPKPVGDDMLAEALPPPIGAPADTALPPVTDNTLDVPAADAPINTASPTLPAPTNSGAMVNSAVPEQTAMETPAPVQNTVVPTPTPVAVVPAAPATSPAEVTALQQRLGEMETQIRALTGELQSVKSAAPATTTDSGVSSDAMKTLNEKLDRLTQQVDALDQRTTTFATELQNRANEPVAAVAKTTPAPAKKAAAKPAPRRPTAAPSSVGGWELRSAQPGAAWMGRRGANEMNRYAVGQAVPGLGTIQSVTQEGGQWVVRTTGGTLRQ